MKRNTIKIAVAFLLAIAGASAQTCTPYRTVNHRIIVKAIVNGKGPYAFLFDTGSQSTLIDTHVFKSNHMTNAGTVDVSGMGLHESTSWTVLDSFEFNGHSVPGLRVVIYDLTKTQGPGDARIFGIIGEDYLERYNVKIDKDNACIEISE